MSQSKVFAAKFPDYAIRSVRWLRNIRQQTDKQPRA